MTKQLEETFNMESLSEILANNEINTQEIEEIDDDFKRVLKVEEEVGTITDLSESDKEIDELTSKAMGAFTDLMELGMNVEQRLAAPIFAVAHGMLGHALKAKGAKVDRRLKAIDLQLKKLQIDRTAPVTQEASQDGVTIGDAKVLDRNELLKIAKQARDE